MYDAQHYPGHEELRQYVNNNKHPNFDSFTLANLEKIAQWSKTIYTTDRDILCQTWFGRFTKLLRSQKPHLDTRKLKLNKKLWTTIAEMREQLTEAGSAYALKSISLMGKYSAKAELICSDDLDQQLEDSHGKRKQKTTLNDAANNESKRQHISDDTINEEEERTSVCSQGSSHATAATAAPTEAATATTPVTPVVEGLTTEPRTTATAATFGNVIFGMGYKKLAGIPWEESEQRLLDELRDGNPFLDIKLCMTPMILKLLTSPLIPADLPLLKLSLSGIVNTMNPTHYQRIKQYLSKCNYEARLDDLVDRFRQHGLDTKSIALLDEINLKLTNNNIEDTISLVDDLKKPYLQSCGRSGQGYRVLRIVEQLLETMESHSFAESEATTTRRIMIIMEEMFRWTRIKLVDGEHVSECTQSMRQYNEIMYGNSDDRIQTGRKIDLLVKCGENKDVELSSIEIKKPLTPPSLVLEQQCKNLTTNGTILNYLQAISSSNLFDHVVAMDWIGMAGYMYLLVDIDGIYYGKKLGTLTLPKSPNDFIGLKTTLDLLFGYQYTMLDLAMEARSAIGKRQELDQMCEIIDIQDQVKTHQHHNIYITPNAHTSSKT